jgi:hypothetical protein
MRQDVVLYVRHSGCLQQSVTNKAETLPKRSDVEFDITWSRGSHQVRRMLLIT